jgi:putative hydrolase of the HAD superfamily
MNFVFDLYGTLVDIWTDESRPEVWRGLAGSLRGCRRRYLWAKEAYSRLCKEEHLGEGREFDLLRVFERMLLEEGGDASLAHDIAREFRENSIVRLGLFPFVKEMLTGLKERGAGVYLLSNAQSCFTRYELDKLGLTPLFDDIIISSETTFKKPSGEIFKIAFEKFGISPEDSVYVGNDMHDDVLGAHGAGMRTAYIETVQSGKYDIELPKPDFVAIDHEHLSNILFDLADSRDKLHK